LQESITISRKKSDAEFDFDTLRLEAIDHLQKLCGSNWTNFNLHDPGVTILEQIVFTLSEMGYKTSFGIEDYLTNDKGTIDYESQGMILPEKILPSAPVTANDFAKALYLNIPEISNIKVEANGFKYKITIVPIGAHNAKLEASIKERVEKFWHENHNLCDTLEEIEINWKKNCYLDGSIVISTTVPVEDTLRHIYNVASSFLSSKIQFQSYAEALKKQTLDEVFDGPLSCDGLLDTKKFDSKSSRISYAELTDKILEIPGVLKVKDGKLTFKKNVAAEGEPARMEVIDDASSVNLDIEIDLHPSFYLISDEDKKIDIHKYLKKIKKVIQNSTEYHNDFLTIENLRNNLPELPSGKKKTISSISPIIDSFPAVYRDQNNIEQLQGYLTPIEKLFNEFLDKVNSFAKTFSSDYEITIDDSEHKESESIISEETDSPKPHREWFRIPKPRDLSQANQINNILNQMLAMYGQEFPDELFNSLRDTSSDNITMDLLLAKQQYLTNIIEYSNQRNKVNWLSRIYALLGMNSENTIDIQKPFFVEGTERGYTGDLFIFWSSETRFTATEEKRRALEEFIQDELPAHIRPIFFWGDPIVLNDEEFIESFFKVYKDPEGDHKEYSEIVSLIKDRTAVIIR
jgi:hypothetical protein